MECFIAREIDIDLPSKILVLRGDEARHAVRVLRISEGEHLLATTLTGFCYHLRCLRSGQPGKNEWVCECAIEEILPEHNEPNIDLQLIQGITLQQSKLEEIIEKITELGIRSIVPIFSRRTEKKSINRERFLRILENACKQSHRSRIPELSEPMSLEESLMKARSEKRAIILLHESAPITDSLSKVLRDIKGRKIALVIGPEGGFDESEVLLAQNTYKALIASLGKRRLRAETAAIAATAIAMSHERI